MKRLSEAHDTFSQGEISECDSCGVSSGCKSVTWSSALMSDDIRVLPSFAVEMVSRRILVGSSGRSVALVLCRVCLWFLMWVRLLLLL